MPGTAQPSVPSPAGWRRPEWGSVPSPAGWRRPEWGSVPSPAGWRLAEWGSVTPRPGLVSLGGGGSVVSNSVAPGTAARQASLFFTISWSWLRLLSVESVMPPSRLILLPPPSPSALIFPGIRVFSSESALCIRWPNLLELQHQAFQ